MKMPFIFVNNVMKGSHLLDTYSQTLFDGNLLYTFDAKVRQAKQLDKEVAKRNKVIGVEASELMWNRNDIPGLPDVTPAENSFARECGIDISREFTVNGETFPALPGFVPGYFKGKAPDAGAFQYGEDMGKFIQMHRKMEELVKRSGK